MRSMAETSRAPLLHGRLSARELEVLQMASLGLRNAEIAERLEVSVHAIKFHLAAVYKKLGVGNRTEAVVAYMGWAHADPNGTEA